MITEPIGAYRLVIQGFSNARLTDPEKTLNDLRQTFEGVDLQLLRADRIAGRDHIVFAARNAINSFRAKARRSKHLSMELLLFASGEHQIVEAIKLLGVDPSTTEVALVGLFGKPLKPELFIRKVSGAINGTPDDRVIDLQYPEKIRGMRKAYKISDREMDSTRVSTETEEMVVQRLVIERSAILVLEN